MKNLIMGIIIGLSLGITPVAYSYYSDSTEANELTASGLKAVIRDALDSCKAEKQYHGGFEIDC